MTILLRFAPSPTGLLHLGGLRTALYNHLYAKKLGGKWILRIEDTDTSRSVPGSVDGIRGALSWAGLEYDYGPGKGGPHAPYFQSERLDLYRSHATQLLDSRHAYRCFCSPDELASTREKLARSGSNATYDKKCLNLTEEEVARRVRAGEKSVVRLNDGRLPIRQTPTDIIFGTLRDAHASLPTDPVLLKSDLFPTYHLASVVDDHHMGITHVLRGEEWLPSFPLHLDLYACLSLPPPQFAHLPLLLNPDGSKMSKRKGDVHVQEFMKRGWEPDAVLNWLALAGWGAHHDESTSQQDKKAPDSTAVMTLPTLIKEFDLSSLTHRRTILDPVKLEYLNKQHLSRIGSTIQGLDALSKRAQALIKEIFPTSQYNGVKYLRQLIFALQGRLTTLHELPSMAPYFFIDPDYISPEAVSMLKDTSGDHYTSAIRMSITDLETSDVEWDRLDLSKVLSDTQASVHLKQKEYMTILRHALSGMKSGPSVPEILEILGRERAIARLHIALQCVVSN